MRLTWQTLAEGSEIFASAANIPETANILFPAYHAAGNFSRVSRRYPDERRKTKTCALSLAIRNHEVLNNFENKRGALIFFLKYVVVRVQDASHAHQREMTRKRMLIIIVTRERDERCRYRFETPAEVIKTRDAIFLSLSFPSFIPSRAKRETPSHSFRYAAATLVSIINTSRQKPTPLLISLRGTACFHRRTGD